MIFHCIIEDLMIIYLQTFFHTLTEKNSDSQFLSTVIDYVYFYMKLNLRNL